jgi:hypothetical protein
LNYVYSTTSSWKSRTRRFLTTEASSKKNTSAKKNSSSLESGQLSTNVVNVDISSILSLVSEVTALPISSRLPPFLNSILDANKDESAPKKKRKKEDGTVGIEKSSELSKLVPVSLNEIPNSSDEESEDSSVSNKCRVDYVKTPDFQMSSLPLKLWPRTNIGPKPLTLTERYAAENSNRGVTAHILARDSFSGVFRSANALDYRAQFFPDNNTSK